MFDWLKGKPNVKKRTLVAKKPAGPQRTKEDVMVDRNVDGIALEKKNDIQGAVQLYELNVRDKFDGSHPYERLRIIYSGQERWLDAIRVCEAYIKHGQKADLTLKAKMLQKIQQYRLRQ